MAWKDLDTELLELFGEASRTRGNVRRAAGERGAKVHAVDIGELPGNGRGLRTSKKVKAAESREMFRFYLRNWYRETKADPERWARLKARYAKWRASPGGARRLKESQRAYRQRTRAQIAGVRECKGCGQPFELSRYREIHKRDRACSMRCRGAARQNIRRVTINGRSMPLVRWAEENGLALKTVWARVARGWSVGRALSTPANPRRCRKEAA